MEIKSERSRYHRFAFYYEYNQEIVDFCRVLKDSFGWQRFSYDSSNDLRRWVFSEVVFLKLLCDRYPQIKVPPDVLAIWQHEDGVVTLNKKQDEALEEVKQKTDTDFQIKGIKGELYPYQKIGVEFLLASGGRAIIADQMGLGKTLQALGYITHSKFKRSLIICPASVKSAWETEVKKWTKLSYIVIDPNTKLDKIDADTNLWIINYDVLKKHLNTLLKTRFDVMVADECHMVKNHQAQRTRAIMQLSQHIPHIVLLSGTPLLSRPVEMFTLLKMIDPKSWGNWYDYTRQYCGGHQGRFGYDASGATNSEELHERIKKYFIRRQKSEVLKQLPPKNRIDQPVEFSPEIRREYDLAEDNLVAYLEQYTGKQPAQIARMIQAEKLAQINVLRHLCAMGKVNAAMDLIDQVIEGDEKILVFSSFLEPLNLIKEKYGAEAVMITGQTPVSERGKVVESFQNNPGVRIFLGGIKSAGVGITLTAASNVLFLDFAWNPADHQQAEDRVHRPGQEAASVNIYQLYVDNTIDGKLQKMLKKKQKVFDKVIDGVKPDDEDTEDSVKAVVDDLMKRKGARFDPMDLSKAIPV